MAIRHYLAFLQRLISNVARILYNFFNKDNIILESKVKTACERPINWTMSYEDRSICICVWIRYLQLHYYFIILSKY